ncbi:T-cell ecto-ADP-ribosyltransferase 2-like isoform X2 [Eleginops maclovinus]|uniref:T-cell ecto-ADP-ribosyltransferase 2-like isoform X2 n=1 Tax=Eleginops maclovinus TaxID=56733 RepID=UPI00307FFCD0
MLSSDNQECQRQTACVISFIVLLVGLLMFVVIYLTLSWQDIVGEDVTYDLNEDMYDDCQTKATVVTNEAIMQKWNTSRNFTTTWSNTEQKPREPAHKYMEKHLSTAIYIYTKAMMQPFKSYLDTKVIPGKQKKTLGPDSLYFSLSKAIQILKHSQVTCLWTNYRTETLLNLNISNKLIRFSTFILGTDGWKFTKNASCFEVYTCFGADITHYSALQLHSQVLIPPYEVFKVTDIDMNTQRCEVLYRLKSNLNCVYDIESNMLHPISALPAWLIFVVACVIIVSLLLPLVIVKVLENHKKTAVYRAPFLHDNTYYKAGVVM